MPCTRVPKLDSRVYVRTVERQREMIFTLLLCALTGCSTHFSTLAPEGSTAQVIYVLSDKQALEIAQAAIVATFPGEGITEINGAVQGYSTSFRFGLDTYSQQIMVYPVRGMTPTGHKIAGVYFEVSGSGTSVVQGRAKNIELFKRVQALAQATGQAATVANVEARGYEEARAEVRHSPEDPSRTCFQNLAHETRFAPIADKMAITNVRETTFAMLANESLPKPEERPVIADLIGAQQACFQDGDLWRQKNYPPQIVAIVAESFNTGVATAADLYNGKLSYGAFNKQRQALADEARNRVAAVVQQIQSQRHAEQQMQKQTREAQQAQANAAREQAVLQLLLKNMTPPPVQPLPVQLYQVPIKPSVHTDCYQMGDHMRCTTR